MVSKLNRLPARIRGHLMRQQRRMPRVLAGQILRTSGGAEDAIAATIRERTERGKVHAGAKRDGDIASDGIRNDRLFPRSEQSRRSIGRIVQAVDGSGRPLHPRLFSLWRWTQTSGHVIYIELIDEKDPQTYRAGFLTMQEPNGKDTSRIAVDITCRNSMTQKPHQLSGYGVLMNDNYIDGQCS